MDESAENTEQLNAAELEGIERSAPSLVQRVQQAREALRDGDDRLAALLRSVPMRRRHKDTDDL